MKSIALILALTVCAAAQGPKPVVDLAHWVRYFQAESEYHRTKAAFDAATLALKAAAGVLATDCGPAAVPALAEATHDPACVAKDQPRQETTK